MKITKLSRKLSERARKELEKAYHSADSDALREDHIEKVFVTIKKYTGQPVLSWDKIPIFTAVAPVKDKNDLPALSVALIAYPHDEGGHFHAAFIKFLEELLNSIIGILSEELDVNPALPEQLDGKVILLYVAKKNPIKNFPRFPVLSVHDTQELAGRATRRVFVVNALPLYAPDLEGKYELYDLA